VKCNKGSRVKARGDGFQSPVDGRVAG
jgi:hypothetical protein